MAVLITRIINKIPVTDIHNGIRAFSRKVAGEIEITHDGMSHASEILSIIHQKKLDFIEVPVRVSYSTYSLAKGQNMLNGVNILWDLFFAEKK
ncbi:MAG: hypothetical protein VB108_09170 [Anaerolineaceae bacterium]|nr:hypothetical protein [Anaerolineaceae bacterium]